ncbi:MAG: YHS domain-containing protein [Candidatus Omnitrophica bacterium]|nr:YHS domain-containing protein [Candidatus Omnitrophota bacterium]MBU4149399.1 YHS domain-containing protein [Candidatus Omnitrophota bacterium]
MKRIVMVLAVAIFFVSPFVFAESEHAGHDHEMMQKGDMQNEQEDLIDVGNKICPVSGEEIGGSMMGAAYEYEGKTYNFCCAGCIDEFKKDPQKYIDKIAEEKALEEEK